MIRIATSFGVVACAFRVSKPQAAKTQTLMEAAEESYKDFARESAETTLKAGLVHSQVTLPDAEKTLKAGQVHSQVTLPDLDGAPECRLSNSACAIEDMKETTVVWADDSFETARCYNGDPWGFIVHPGAADKLYYYFPGGGTCFDFPWLNFELRGCVDSMIGGLLSSGAGTGLADMSDSRSGIQGFSMVMPVYCHGGGHISNNTFESGGETYYQYGYNSNEIARQWALTNFPGRLDRFVIAGSSAGSLGAGIWADTLLGSFRYNKASVVLDSYMSVFPGNSQGLLLQQLGACNLPPLAPFRADCEAGQGDMQYVLDYTIAKYPNVAFAHIQSKEDAVQLAFYTVVGAAFGGGLTIDKGTFYWYTNYLMDVYNKHPNYVTYIVNGEFHVFPPYPVEWYSTSTLGPNTTATVPDGVPMLFEWFNDLIEHRPVRSQCTGSPLWNGAPVVNYCYWNLVDKTLIV